MTRAFTIIAALLSLGFIAIGIALEAQDAPLPIAQNMMERHRAEGRGQ